MNRCLHYYSKALAFSVTAYPHFEDNFYTLFGYKSTYALLETLKLPISKNDLKIPLHNPKVLETPLKSVFIAGVLIADMRTSKLFIENTRQHSVLIIR